MKRLFYSFILRLGGVACFCKTEWNKDGAVVITNPEPIDPWYSLQYWLVDGISLKPGTTYKITILCKAEGKSPAHVRFKLGNWGDNFELKMASRFLLVVVIKKFRSR